MTVRSLALATIIAAAAPAVAVAQTTPSHLVTTQMSSPRPEGHATDVTDHSGLTKVPLTAMKSPTPKHVPGWHIPLPHIHKGK